MASSQPDSPIEGRLASPPITTAAERAVRSANASLRNESHSESSDEGFRMSPAAARRFARRNLRRTSPTPDLVTSLVRPPSPDAFYAAPRVHSQARQESFTRAAQVTTRITTQKRSGPSLQPHMSSLDIPKRYGGSCVFDMYALNYVSDPDSNLHCPICHDPLVDPVTTPCDHTFCYRCLRRSISSSPSGTACPIDREPLSWLDCTSAARLIRTQLNGLTVHCPYQDRGCSRQFRRELVEFHAKSECKFREYACPVSSCSKKLRSKPTDDLCQHQQEQCTLCEGTIETADRSEHLLSCPRSKTRCEACWELISRNQMSLHREVDCDGVEIACPYQDVGCPVRTMRGFMSSHSSSCGFHPETATGIIVRSQRDLIQSYGDMSSKMEEMRARQEEAAMRIDGLLATVNMMSGGDTALSDNRTMQDLDAGFEEVHQNLTQLEARQSMWTMTQVMPIREEVTELRNNINMIRMHVNWLLNRSREEGRIRAANNAGSSSTIRRDGSGDVPPVMPERRRSSGAEADLPRL